ncbi:MAG: hypothetical protein ACI4XS_07955 [Bacillus sp. (in: firmicutes)]
MIRKISALLLLSVLFVSNAFAHVMNSDNVFTDISYSEAKDDIVLLHSLGVISYQYEEYIFRPQDPLAKQELASWAGSYFRLEGETSEQLAKAALAEGYITSLTGIATYQDVNQAFFQNQLTLDNPNDALTREQFAQFVAANVDIDVSGQSLYEMSGFSAGPVGVVEAVQQVEKLTSEGETKKVYELTIDGEVYELGLHPRITAQVADPNIWVGMTVTKSSIGPNVETDATGTHSSTHGHSHDTDAGSLDHSHHEESSDASENTISQYALQFIQLDSAATDDPEVATKNVGNSEAVSEETEQDSQSWKMITAAVLILAAVLIVLIKRKQNIHSQ